MPELLVEACSGQKVDAAWWNSVISSLEGAHILQTWEWAEHKSKFGWECFPFWWVSSKQKIHLCSPENIYRGEVVGAVMLLRRPVMLSRFRLPVNVLYSSKGPLVVDQADFEIVSRVLSDLTAIGKDLRGIFIKIDPDVPVGFGEPGTANQSSDFTGLEWEKMLKNRGWHFSGEQIQFRNTVQIDLRPEEKDILAGMKQKTRYNIRLAARKGVCVRVADVMDLTNLYQMYAETADRDGFIIRQQNYYLDLWQAGIQAGLTEALIAELHGEPIAGVVIFKFANQAWYLFGMSRDIHRNMMPNYLLQWEAIRRARVAGCRVYDLWGAPNQFDSQDQLWGVYRFKVGLGGRTVRHIGAWDYPLKPSLYKLYTTLLPRLLGWMRRLRRAQIHTEAQSGNIE